MACISASTANNRRRTLISRLSSRDDFIPRDAISITLDPGGSGLYGYWFGVNLGGTLQDGTVLPERQYSSRWDGPWNGASVEVEGGYDTEFFLALVNDDNAGIGEQHPKYGGVFVPQCRSQE